MRDPILDRLVQPAVLRFAIPTTQTSIELSILFGATAVVSATYKLLMGGDLLTCALQVAFSMAMMRFLRLGAHIGSAILDTPIAFVHLLGRLLFLAIALCSLLQLVLGTWAGIVSYSPTKTMMLIASNIGSFALSASLFIGVCDEPPRQKRNQREAARA